jgi:hypothetical protein
MRKINRRDFARSVGAGLLLAPFLSLGPGDRRARAATGKAKRLLLFCTMGTKPEIWTPTGLSGDQITQLSASTAPLMQLGDDLVMVEGLPTSDPGEGHASPEALTGRSNGDFNRSDSGLKPAISVEQFIADGLVAAGIKTPVPSLLLGANTSVGSSNITMFMRGGSYLPTIGSPLSAFNTVYGTGISTSTPPDALLARQKRTIDLLKREISEISAALSSNERLKLQAQLDSIGQVESRLMQTSTMGGSCTKPSMAPSDATDDSIAADLLHMDIIAGAFACDVTRVAALQFGSDMSLILNVPSLGLQAGTDQHGGVLHGKAMNGDYSDLIKVESWFAQRFVDMVNKLKTIAEPDGSGYVYDNTLVVWCRDMGDAVVHSQNSMRFVLAGGAGGYLKTGPGGRYIHSTERHERVLLNLCEAMGITKFTGFGDASLSSAAKTPLPGISS